MTTELSYLLSFGTRSKVLIQICSHPFSVAFSSWQSIVGSKSFHSSHDSATSLKVSGVLQVPPGGYWGPFLDSPGNFSGPKSNIQIEIQIIRARGLASKLLHFCFTN